MGKIWIEVCLISARGLRRSSLLWKLQWFAVGWIEPNNKYCTKVDASGNSNPTWKTKFSTSVDYSESNFPDLILTIEVYSREPVFLRERLQGSASVSLKEFMVKYTKDVDKVLNPGSDQVGSFQLRKKNSSKSQGFVDVSVRISEDREDKSSYPGNDEGIQLMDHHNGNTLANSPHAYPSEIPIVLKQRPGTYPIASDSGPSYLSPGGPSYQPQQTHLPPPPPSNVGYIPTFSPRKDHVTPTYMNMPSSGHPSKPGFGMGMGAGALAAGALIFGDDFMSGFNVPAGIHDSLTVATDPPF